MTYRTGAFKINCTVQAEKRTSCGDFVWGKEGGKEHSVERKYFVERVENIKSLCDFNCGKC